MREYHLSDPIGPGITLKCKNDKDCIFCKHCTCLWDYANGPYMFFCSQERAECDSAESPEAHTCELFEDRLTGGESNAWHSI